MNFEIRPMKQEDVIAVVLVDTLAGILMPWSPHAYSGELQKTSSWCWVAETVAERPFEYVMPFPAPIVDIHYAVGDKAVIGSLTMWDIAAREAEIANVSVHPLFQRQGIGHALIETALAKARQHGMEKVMLEVRASNEPAKSLYAILGFVEDGRRPHYYSNGEDAILMSLSS